MYGVRVCSNFTDLHAAVQLSQHHTAETVFSPLYIFASFIEDKKTDCRRMGLFLASLFWFH